MPFSYFVYLVAYQLGERVLQADVNAFVTDEFDCDVGRLLVHISSNLFHLPANVHRDFKGLSFILNLREGKILLFHL